MTKAGPFLGRCIPPPPFERANTKDSFLIKHNISVSIHIFVKTALTGWCSIILVNRKYHAIYIHFVDKQKHAVSIQTKLNLKLNKLNQNFAIVSECKEIPMHSILVLQWNEVGKFWVDLRKDTKREKQQHILESWARKTKKEASCWPGSGEAGG